MDKLTITKEKQIGITKLMEEAKQLIKLVTNTQAHSIMTHYMGSVIPT